MIRKTELTKPVLALMLASLFVALLVAYRLAVGCQVRHAYLVWNLFLAWLPLGLALLAVIRFERAGTWRDGRFLSLALGWLLFLPNAPYIITDLTHVRDVWSPTNWVPLMMILLSALTGLLTGFLSLELMHTMVKRLWGGGLGWLFIAVVSGLSAFGVYLGRFVRLNSWDVVTSPVEVMYGIYQAVGHALSNRSHTKFLLLFALILWLAHVMLFALAKRREDGATLRNLSVE